MDQHGQRSAPAVNEKVAATEGETTITIGDIRTLWRPGGIQHAGFNSQGLPCQNPPPPSLSKQAASMNANPLQPPPTALASTIAAGVTTNLPTEGAVLFAPATRTGEINSPGNPAATITQISHLPFDIQAAFNGPRFGTPGDIALDDLWTSMPDEEKYLGSNVSRTAWTGKFIKTVLQIYHSLIPDESTNEGRVMKDKFLGVLTQTLYDRGVRAFPPSETDELSGIGAKNSKLADEQEAKRTLMVLLEGLLGRSAHTKKKLQEGLKRTSKDPQQETMQQSLLDRLSSGQMGPVLEKALFWSLVESAMSERAGMAAEARMSTGFDPRTSVIGRQLGTLASSHDIRGKRSYGQNFRNNPRKTQDRAIYQRTNLGGGGGYAATIDPSEERKPSAKRPKTAGANSHHGLDAKDDLLVSTSALKAAISEGKLRDVAGCARGLKRLLEKDLNFTLYGEDQAGPLPFVGLSAKDFLYAISCLETAIKNNEQLGGLASMLFPMLEVYSNFCPKCVTRRPLPLDLVCEQCHSGYEEARSRADVTTGRRDQGRNEGSVPPAEINGRLSEGILTIQNAINDATVLGNKRTLYGLQSLLSCLINTKREQRADAVHAVAAARRARGKPKAAAAATSEASSDSCNSDVSDLTEEGAFDGSPASILLLLKNSAPRKPNNTYLAGVNHKVMDPNKNSVQAEAQNKMVSGAFVRTENGAASPNTPNESAPNNTSRAAQSAYSETVHPGLDTRSNLKVFNPSNNNSNAQDQEMVDPTTGLPVPVDRGMADPSRSVAPTRLEAATQDDVRTADVSTTDSVSSEPIAQDVRHKVDSTIVDSSNPRLQAQDGRVNLEEPKQPGVVASVQSQRQNQPTGASPIKYGENDVLLGRNPICWHHKGNVKFRELIAKYHMAYKACSTRPSKSVIIAKIRDGIEMDGGKFLVQEGNEGKWTAVSTSSSIRSKISNALRDKYPSPSAARQMTSKKSKEHRAKKMKKIALPTRVRVPMPQPQLRPGENHPLMKKIVLPTRARAATVQSQGGGVENHQLMKKMALPTRARAPSAQSQVRAADNQLVVSTLHGLMTAVPPVNGQNGFVNPYARS